MIIFVVLCCLFSKADSQGFSVTTATPLLKVPEFQGADLKCSYTGNFGANPRVEWNIKRLQGSSFVFYDGNPTEPYKGRVTQYPGGLRFNKVTREDNGEYACSVAGADHTAEVKINLIVLVPPSVPICSIPTSVSTGSQAILSCRDKDASPAATYKWFMNNEPLPEDPSKFEAFKNMSYKMDAQRGILDIPMMSHANSGDYFCEASNEAGPPQSCVAVRMIAYDVNVGGIVAGVIIALLIVIALVIGAWFAYRKGYIPKMAEGKPKTVVYTQPPATYDDEEDGEFKQKSSFVV